MCVHRVHYGETVTHPPSYQGARVHVAGRRLEPLVRLHDPRLRRRGGRVERAIVLHRAEIRGDPRVGALAVAVQVECESEI